MYSGGFSAPVAIDIRPKNRVHSTSECDYSSSPAASFLTAFSPPPVSTNTFQDEDAEGSIISGYTLGRIIGHGAFSTIRLASSSSSNGTVVAKIVPHGHGMHDQQDNNESLVWADLSHEHLLPLFSNTTTLYASYFFTLYCPAGSLLDIINRHAPSRIVPQDDAGTMFRQVVRGLRYMHEVAGYVHGDIKLENILVDEMGVCRISDFGLAKKIHRDSVQPLQEESSSETDDIVELPHIPARKPGTHHLSLKRKARGRHPLLKHRNTTTVMENSSTPMAQFPAGSLPYAAPELLAPNHFQRDSGLSPFADPAQDIWALGVLLFALLTGKLPFSDAFEPRLTMKILRGTYTIPPEHSDIGQGAERVLKGCLEKTVKERWTIEMVDEVSWGVGWGEVAWDVEPKDAKEAEWEPAPASVPTRPPSMSRRSSSISRSRARERHSHDPVPMTKESRSKSRSSRVRASLEVDGDFSWQESQHRAQSQSRSQSRRRSLVYASHNDEDEDDAAWEADTSMRSLSQSKSRSQSRRRAPLCPDLPEEDEDDASPVPTSRTPLPSIQMQAVAEMKRGRRPDRKFPESPELLLSALSISSTDTEFDRGLTQSPSPSPSPSLVSPSSSLILMPGSVHVASCTRTMSGDQRMSRMSSRERNSVRFQDSEIVGKT